MTTTRTRATRAGRAAACLLTCGLASAASAQGPEAEALRVMQEVAATDSVPSLSVAVARGGSLVFARALGLADLEHEVAATDATVYPIGSVTKTLTAVAALQLAEGGRLDLDRPVQQYCPAFPRGPALMTVRQLLAHTAGVRHYDYRRFDEDFLNTRRFASIDDALSKFAADPLVGEPGEQFHYSSWGYVLVGCAIEGASGESYAAYLTANVIQPADMAQTQLDVVAEIVASRARGYARTDDGALVNAGLFDASDRYPAGGLLSTPADLARFASALLRGELLGADGRRQLWSSATLSTGEPTGYGLGWDLADDGTAVYHGGTAFDATTFLYVRPDEDIVVAIAVNLALWPRDRLELAQRLADLFQ